MSWGRWAGAAPVRHRAAAPIVAFLGGDRESEEAAARIKGVVSVLSGPGLRCQGAHRYDKAVQAGGRRARASHLAT